MNKKQRLILSGVAFVYATILLVTATYPHPTLSRVFFVTQSINALGFLIAVAALLRTRRD